MKTKYFITNANGVQKMIWTATTYQLYQEDLENVFDDETQAQLTFFFRREIARNLEIGDNYYLITKQLRVIECSWQNTLPEYNSMCRNEIFFDKKQALEIAKHRKALKKYLKSLE